MKSMKMKILFLVSMLVVLGCKSDGGTGEPVKQEPKEVPEPLAVGYSVAIANITADKMSKAKAAGIEYVEAAGTNTFFDGKRDFIKTDAEAASIMTKAKQAADNNGITIWSVHMPYSEEMDLSTINEADRQKVVAGHKKLLEHLKILKPKVILFHPSYYLDPPNQRDLRISQLIKSVTELNEAVQAIGAVMVVENMLGPELMSGARERPLMRTVEEAVDIFKRLPASVYAAIDMNHIKNPENLIRAMGKRLKSVHIADGSGRAENHYFPCSGEGQNNWVEILKALDEAGYQGPFMFESAYDSEQALADCYQTLYNNFIKNIK